MAGFTKGSIPQKPLTRLTVSKIVIYITPFAQRNIFWQVTLSDGIYGEKVLDIKNKANVQENTKNLLFILQKCKKQEGCE